MDKLLHKNWLVKIISFVTALMLYAIVSSGENPSPDPSNILENNEQQATVTERLNVRYNSDQDVVSGAPHYVKIRMRGSGDLLLKARLLASRSAFIDLTRLSPGTYDVRVRTSGFPAGLKVTPVPDTVRITLQRKSSKELPVGIDILNKNKISQGLAIGDPVIDPQTVTVTGGENSINSIAFIKGVINVSGADSTADSMITLHAYDNNGNQLNVTITPSAVHVRVPLIKVSKQMAIQAAASGRPANGYAVRSIDLSEKSVTVFTDDSKTLDSITDLPPLSVPVDGLNKDKTIKVRVPLPDGATKVSPGEVEATVHIVKTGASSGGSSQSQSVGSRDSAVFGSSVPESSGSGSSASGSSVSKVFKGIPITVKGLSSAQKATFNQNDDVNVTVSGTSSVLDRLTEKDIQASVNLKGLSAGDHQVAVDVTVPEGLSGLPAPHSVGVKITDKNKKNDTSA
ncbi:hypothetical protein EWI07_05260 [Sporolactobacillus sp. THM7-4]|nr:hypothetical protein EWI07_05260 [Sporolactobacillus sp. THM7-4]